MVVAVFVSEMYSCNLTTANTGGLSYHLIWNYGSCLQHGCELAACLGCFLLHKYHSRLCSRVESFCSKVRKRYVYCFLSLEKTFQIFQIPNTSTKQRYGLVCKDIVRVRVRSFQRSKIKESTHLKSPSSLCY